MVPNDCVLMLVPSFQISGMRSVGPPYVSLLTPGSHKIVAKRGAAFTIMVGTLRHAQHRDRDLRDPQVAGESGLGKTTFINTLFSTTIKNYADHRRRHAKQVDKTVEIEITKAELEEKFFKGRKLLCRRYRKHILSR